MEKLRRATRQTVALKTDNTSPIIDIGGYASGEVVIPTATTTVTLTYFIVDAGNFYAAQDATPAAITQTVAADKAYPLPAALMGAGQIQIRGNAAGNIGLILKT